MASQITEKKTAIDITEYNTLKASCELINKTYRQHHRDMEKEVAGLNKTIDEADKVETMGEAVTFLDKVISGVSSLKRKADITFNEEHRLVQNCKRRIEHLAAMSKIQKTEMEKVNTTEHRLVLPAYTKAVYNQRLNRLLADHLFTNGHYWTAIKVSESCCQTPDGFNLCLIEIYRQTGEIEAALRKGDTSLAHAWCQEFNFKLKKIENNFEFELRVFEFYLLAKAGKRLEAVKHAQKYLNNIESSDSYRATKLRKSMFLLIVRNDKDLVDLANLSELAEDWIVSRFRATNLKFYCFSDPTPFSLTVKAGISVIKSHDCYKEGTKKTNCIVCHSTVNELAKSLPYGRHDHSLLTCWQTGLPMNDDNPPMALPNGYVYSQLGLLELVDDVTNKIRCPRTGDDYSFKDAQRVYIV